MSEGSEDDYGPAGSSGSESDRPNRWEGPSSTWQDMNREEINTLRSINELKDRDLSVHLYNSFVLKQRHQDHGENHTGPVPERVKDSPSQTRRSQ